MQKLKTPSLTEVTDEDFQVSCLEACKILQHPAYVIDQDRLQNNCQRLKNFEEKTGAKILLALKAFSNPNSLALISSYLSGATASSKNEMTLAKKYFNDVHVYSLILKEIDLNTYFDNASHLVMNSMVQYQKFLEIEDSYKKSPSIGVRVNPNYAEVDVEMYNPCKKNSRFGLQRHECESLDWSKIEGIHFHALCEQNADVLERVLQIFEQQYGSFLKHCKWLNLGGGHLLNSKGYDLDLCEKLISSLQNKYEVEIFLEPGEAVVSNTTYVVATVQDIIYRDVPIVILDVSASAHMPDVLEMPYRPYIYGSKPEGSAFFTYEICGCTCLSGDIMGRYSFEAPIKIGDQLVFGDMGQYTMVKNTFFNGIEMPAICHYSQAKGLEVQRQFTHQDYESRLG